MGEKKNKTTAKASQGLDWKEQNGDWDFINDMREKDKEYVGFIYCITEKDTQMKYYGIKQLKKRIRRKPLKGQKRVRIDYVESDWKKYNTSSPIMQDKLAKNRDNYYKAILHYCETKTELKAREAYMQLDEYLNGDWTLLYNQVINLRLRIR